MSAAGGSFLKDFAEARYGFRLGRNVFCRVYGRHFGDQRNTVLQNGKDSKDAWNATQGGFRMDFDVSAASSFTLQGDVYTIDETTRPHEPNWTAKTYWRVSSTIFQINQT